MALMAGMMLAGCSKSDDEPSPQYKLTKDNIVGVWRSGDYWVSFSSDGYMSAYLSDKCIAEGGHRDLEFLVTSRVCSFLSHDLYVVSLVVTLTGWPCPIAVPSCSISGCRRT